MIETTGAKSFYNLLKLQIKEWEYVLQEKTISGFLLKKIHLIHCYLSFICNHLWKWLAILE